MNPKIDRRKLLKMGLAATVGASAVPVAVGQEKAPEETPAPSPDYVGVLVDTTLCIGCRKCEEACNRRNHLPRTAEAFSDRDVLRTFRRPTDKAFTVVNQFPGSPSPDQPTVPQTYAKVQCMHCLIPSCVSACIVGALTKTAEGAVVYNSSICIGCRYCQVACPFQVPAYEFNEPLKPRVRKCEFCTDAAAGLGPNPACAASCPTEALVFGRRAELIAMAHDRLKRRPDRYVDHIYGETEVGGTSWLYLTGRPVQEIGLLQLPEAAPPRLTESIQHGIFRYGFFPIAFWGVLAGVMWYNNRQHPDEHPDVGKSGDQPSTHEPEGGAK